MLGVASPVFMLDLELGASFSSRLSFLLTCFVRGSSHHLVLVQPFEALFIKRDERLFREINVSVRRSCLDTLFTS